MRRIRLSTAMLLIVIVALSFALGVQKWRADRLEAAHGELRARLGVNTAALIIAEESRKNLEVQLISIKSSQTK